MAITRSGQNVDDRYIKNIHYKIVSSGSTFPAQAKYYCEQELERRRKAKEEMKDKVRYQQNIDVNIKWQNHNDEMIVDRHHQRQMLDTVMGNYPPQHNCRGYDMANSENHYSQPKASYILKLNRAKEDQMQNNKDLAERTVQLVTKIKDDQLPNYFGKKVKWFENGEDYKVIAIRISGTGHKQLLLMPYITTSNPNTRIELDAHEVDIVKQIVVYAYQQKSGEITYSSKEILPSTLKKQGIKKIESMTKYFDA